MEDQELQETLEAAEPTEDVVLDIDQTQPVAEAKQTPNDRNIKQLRQKAEERDYYYKRMQELEVQQQSARQPEVKEEAEPAPDDLVEWKQVQKRFAKLEKEIDSYKQQSNTNSAEARIKMKYPDFESVVNADNIAILREEYPELAATVNSNPDLYTKAAAAYTLLKKLNIAPDMQYAQDRTRVQQNAAKPRPLTSMSPQQGDSALSKANPFANGLTPEIRAQLLKEMAQAKKG